MAISQVITYDGDFSVPVEVNGSPMISTDPITRSKTIVRSYAVWKAFYNPLIYGTFQRIPDRQFPTAILIEEIQQQVDGPFFWFQRVYCEVPGDRTEPLVYAFPMPGKSAVTLSTLTGRAVNWRQYGNGAPYTRAVLSRVDFTYKAGDPGADGTLLFTIPALTRIVYNSVQGPISVDYVGDVYEYAGTRAIVSQQGGISVLTNAEPNFVFVGSTVPRTIPTSWIQEVTIRRWRGAIWEMATITVPTAGL